MVLGVFLAAGKQNHQRPAAPHEIHSVAGTEVYSQLRDAFANRLYIAGVTERQTSNTGVDTRPGLSITQSIEPLEIRLGLPNFNHGSIVSHGIRQIKKNLRPLAGLAPDRRTLWLSTGFSELTQVRDRPERDEGLPPRRRSSRIPDSRAPRFRRPSTPLDEHGERSHIQEAKAPRRSVEGRTFKPDLEWRPFPDAGKFRDLSRE